MSAIKTETSAADLIGTKRYYAGDHGTMEVTILDYRGLGFFTVQGRRGTTFAAQAYELGLAATTDNQKASGPRD